MTTNRKPSLRGCDLAGADLTNAVLTDMDLTRTDFTRALLRGADLSGSNLRWSDLSGVDLRTTDLRGTYLNGAQADGETLLPPHCGSRVAGNRILHGSAETCPWCNEETTEGPYRRLDAASGRRLCPDCTDDAMDAEQAADDGIGAPL